MAEELGDGEPIYKSSHDDCDVDASARTGGPEKKTPTESLADEAMAARAHARPTGRPDRAGLLVCPAWA
jgi:hypothetical protein